MPKHTKSIGIESSLYCEECRFVAVDGAILAVNLIGREYNTEGKMHGGDYYEQEKICRQRLKV